MVIRLSIILAACASNSLAQCVAGFGNGFTLPGSPISPRSAITADVNNDGILDVLVCASALGSVQCSIGTNGAFLSPTSTSTGASPIAVVAAHFNNDANIDFAVVRSGVSIPQLFTGNGAGVFTAGAAMASGGASSTALAAGDFNADGRADLAVTFGTSNTVAIYLALGGGTFAAPVSYGTGGTAPIAIALGDTNGDGLLDVITANSNNVGVLFGNGNGTLNPTPNTIAIAAPNSVAAGDLNGDGRADIIATNANTGATRVLSLGGGAFGAPVSILGGAGMRSVGLFDFSFDGRLDFAIADAANHNMIYAVGLGNGNFDFADTINAPFGPWGVAFGDFNGDSRIDLLTSCNSSNFVHWLPGSYTTAPNITSDPTTIVRMRGQPASFSVTSLGNPLTYQWRRNRVNLTNTPPYSGVNTPTLNISAVEYSHDRDIYEVIITNFCGTARSLGAGLTVSDCPGDFNHDGSVDFFDYLDFVDVYSTAC